jgi:hypothetical protein
VEFHLKNIYSKLQVSSRTELIIKLGNSVVAGQEEITENRDRSNRWNWSTSLKEAVSKIGKELHMESVLNSNARDGANPMTFFESIVVCLKKYADFTGRASRPELWWFMLFIVLVASMCVYVSQTLGNIFGVAILLPFLAVGTRRLRDVGKSHWWLLFLLAPVAGIVVVGTLWAMPTASPQPDETIAS